MVVLENFLKLIDSIHSQFSNNLSKKKTLMPIIILIFETLSSLLIKVLFIFVLSSLKYMEKPYYSYLFY